MKIKKCTRFLSCILALFLCGAIVSLEAKVIENTATDVDKAKTDIAVNAGFNNDDEMMFGNDVATTIQELKKYTKRQATIQGLLRVRIRYARNLPDTDGWLNDPDPYVRVRAILVTGFVLTNRTRDISGTRNPTWNEWLEMGCSTFKNLTVQIFDEDIGSDDPMSTREEIQIVAGYRSGIRHCIAPGSCGSYMIFDYSFIRDGAECSPNPCLNGGRCLEGCSSYTCVCNSSHTGDRCQYRQGRLIIFARYGSGLPDRDGFLDGDSDPYMRVTAYDYSGNSHTLETRTERGDQSPDWDQYLAFGTDTWRRFEVSVWDSDPGADDRLSNTQGYSLPTTSGRNVTNARHNAHSGYVIFDYIYIIQ